jgi:hypothetical protein
MLCQSGSHLDNSEGPSVWHTLSYSEFTTFFFWHPKTAVLCETNSKTEEKRSAVSDDHLSPCNGHFAVGTVSEESGSVHRADKDLAASAVVDLDLGGVVQQKDLAVCEVL